VRGAPRRGRLGRGRPGGRSPAPLLRPAPTLGLPQLLGPAALILGAPRALVGAPALREEPLTLRAPALLLPAALIESSPLGPKATFLAALEQVGFRALGHRRVGRSRHGTRPRLRHDGAGRGRRGGPAPTLREPAAAR